MTQQQPWDYHPDLSEDRLSEIAKVLVLARREALDLYDEAGGDTAWGLGCRAYDRTRTKLIRKSDEITWLSIIDPSLQFIFQIGNVPIRFYRGVSDQPKSNTLACSYPELRQLTLAFPSTGNDEDLLWRFAIETNEIGDVTDIVFIGTDVTGVVHCKWVAQNIDEIMPEGMLPSSDEGVELPQPVVGIPGDLKTQTID